jgi:predicted transcriptional regulator YdeE
MHRSYRVAFALAAVALVSQALAQSPATKTVHQDEFSIVGIEARTSAEQEMAGDGQIAALWQKFYQDHVLEKIPNKSDKNIYAVYTDYSRDRMGAYTVVIGAKVRDKTPAPAGMALKTIPAGQYVILTSERGAADEVIPAAWQRIWALEDKDQLGGKRAYKSDYEVYAPGATDPQNTQADLYIGLRSDQK